MAEGRFDEYIGKPTSRSVLTVERGPVSNFAKGVKDENPVYLRSDAAREAGFDDIPAPPTFVFAGAHWGTFPEEQPEVPSDAVNPMAEIMGTLLQEGGLILHGEQEFEYHRPVTVGMKLRHEGRLADVYERESKGRTMTFVVTEDQYRDGDGELVATARMNLIHRS